MSDDTEVEISYHEAQAALQRKSREVLDKMMRPDGYTIGIHVYDPRRVWRDLPNVSIRLWANGTWEYTDDDD